LKIFSGDKLNYSRHITTYLVPALPSTEPAVRIIWRTAGLWGRPTRCLTRGLIPTRRNLSRKFEEMVLQRVIIE